MGTLPAGWDLNDYLLWPREYGGSTWALGSGAIQHCAPRLGNVHRREKYLKRIRELVERRGMRWSENSKKGMLYFYLYGERV